MPLHPYPIPSPYLEDLIAALEQVNSQYCHWPIAGSRIQEGERVFAYELYHQLRIVAITKPQLYQDIRYDGEINKSFREEFFYCRCTLEAQLRADIRHRISARFSPDLVLHRGQIDRNPENQKLIIEIKTGELKPKPLAKDILKLNHFLRTLNFECGYFIAVNVSLSEVSSQLRNLFPDYRMDYSESLFHKIVIITYDGFQCELALLSAILTRTGFMLADV
jgi:hypothetical protein